MAEPKCIEVSVSASSGGKVSLVKYDLNSTFQYTHTRKYSIPEDWTEEQVDEFEQAKHKELYKKVDTEAQREAEDLMDQSALFNEEGEYIG